MMTDAKNRNWPMGRTPRIVPVGGLVIDVDLVLIHGFWSSPKTWDKLTRLFEADEELDGLRVHGFPYPSPKLPPFPFSTTRIPDYNDIAQSLRPFLRAKKERTHTAS